MKIKYFIYYKRFRKRKKVCRVRVGVEILMQSDKKTFFFSPWSTL